MSGAAPVPKPKAGDRRAEVAVVDGSTRVITTTADTTDDVTAENTRVAVFAADVDAVVYAHGWVSR